MAKKKSKASSGVSVTRSGSTFTAEWKIPSKADYKSQQAQYCINGGGWVGLNNPGKNATTTAVAISLEQRLATVSFRVRGKKKGCKWSDWAEGSFSLGAPRLPSITYNVTDSDRSDISWSIEANDTDNWPCTGYTVETIYVPTGGVSNGGSAPWNDSSKWSSGKVGALEGSRQIDEDTSGWIGEDYSYTRWIRVKAHGPGADRQETDFVYASHTFAMPSRPKNVSAKLQTSGNSGYSCSISWETGTASDRTDRPIDSVTPQYLIEKPVVTASVVDGKKKFTMAPPVANYTNLRTMRDVDGAGGYTFIISDEIPANRCVFARVQTTHDSETANSDAVIVSENIRYLSDPELISTVPSADDTTTYQVTAKNNSDIENSYLAIYYCSTDKPNEQKIVGIMDVVNAQRTMTIRIPTVETGSIKFGVRAFIADYSPVEPDESGVTIYSISTASEGMASREIIWQEGEIPLPPSNVGIATLNGTNDTIQVTWDWSWNEATQTELSWADHRDAWESTSEPTTYLVDNTHPGRWNISGLAVGEWFIRIRFVKTDGDNSTYGFYSRIYSHKLSSAPEIPTLYIQNEDKVVGIDDSVTCYWGYVSTDGTPQQEAIVAEAIYDSYKLTTDISVQSNQTYYTRSGSGTDESPYVYTKVDNPIDENLSTYYNKSWDVSDYSVIGSSQTVQHLTLYPNQLGWHEGETHYIAVKVTSSSGEESDGWSTTVPITIAEPPVATIVATSLIDRTYSILPIDSIEYELVTNEDYNGNVIATSSQESIDLIESASFDYSSQDLIFNQDDDMITDFYLDSNGDLIANVLNVERDSLVLDKLPLILQVSGAGSQGIVRAIIERHDNYQLERPDENEFIGYKGETVAIKDRVGDGQLIITKDDLLQQNLDDGASYNLIVTVIDSNNQSDETSDIPAYHYSLTEDEEIDNDKFYYTRTQVGTEDNFYYVYTKVVTPVVEDRATYFERTLYYATSFEVRWAHQAVVPSANVVNDDDEFVTFITPELPEEGYAEGDTCDIYRLSADRPELIYSGAEFGNTYVDPFPTLGTTFSGHRIVYKTVDGDYITDENVLAWTDYTAEDGNYLDVWGVIIDFGDDQITLPYNVDMSNSWSKDFTATKYLGGSIQGDWNPIVDKQTTVNTVSLVDLDPETIQLVRKLATYAGICHVRTPDGSSFTANVDVKESRENRKINVLSNITLDITRVDSAGLEGMTYSEWADEDIA